MDIINRIISDTQNSDKKISTDTHNYDYKIGPLYRKYKVIDKKLLEQPLSFDETIDDIFKYADLITDKERFKNVIRTLELLISDSHNNYDDKNHISINDLLPRTFRFIKHYDNNGILIFLEQLSDIVTSGQCSQGRTTRIYQFYEHHMDIKDEIYIKCLK